MLLTGAGETNVGTGVRPEPGCAPLELPVQKQRAPTVPESVCMCLRNRTCACVGIEFIVVVLGAALRVRGRGGERPRERERSGGWHATCDGIGVLMGAWVRASALFSVLVDLLRVTFAAGRVPRTHECERSCVFVCVYVFFAVAIIRCWVGG